MDYHWHFQNPKKPWRGYLRYIVKYRFNTPRIATIHCMQHFGMLKISTVWRLPQNLNIFQQLMVSWWCYQGNKNHKKLKQKQKNMFINYKCRFGTPPKTNMEPQHWNFVDVSPFPFGCMFRFYVSFRGYIHQIVWMFPLSRCHLHHHDGPSGAWTELTSLPWRMTSPRELKHNWNSMGVSKN